MWQSFDEGEIRDDFAHIAALGFDSVRFFIRWDALQPRRAAVDASILARIERVVALAADATLRVLPTLCGAQGNVSFMPAWTRPMRDLYTGPLLDAQVAIAHAIGERITGHPALVAYDIGQTFSSVRVARAGSLPSGEHASEPVAERDVAAWSAALAGAVRAWAIAATAGAYDDDLTSDNNLRFGSLCAPLAFASMQGRNERLPFARDPFDPDAIPFLAMLTAAFSFKPVLVSGIASATFPRYREDDNAAYATAVLERLHADGRRGAYWWCWSDAPATVDTPHEPLDGIISVDGTEKPIATVLSAFAREARECMKPVEMPMISSTYYYRTLPVSMQTLYDAYLAFIAERGK